MLVQGAVASVGRRSHQMAEQAVELFGELPNHQDWWVYGGSGAGRRCGGRDIGYSFVCTDVRRILTRTGKV